MRKTLWYDSTMTDTSAVAALVFGELIALVSPVLTEYRSDLYEDALFLAEHLRGSEYVFDYAFNESGTQILPAGCVPTTRAHAYRVAVRVTDGRATVDIEPTKRVPITVADAGTWLDGSQGWINSYRVIDRAVAYGMPYSADDDAIRDAYAAELESVTLSDGTTLDQASIAGAIIDQGELSDRATEYLNSLAPDGYAFIWDAGEFGLYAVDDNGEEVF